MGIKLTLWDDHIHLVDENDTAAKCLAVKGVRISDFGGRSLSTMRNSMAEVSPDLPAAHALRGWYEHVGKKENFTSLSGGGGGPKRSKFISDIKSENLGHEKPEYFSLRCWVTYIKHEGTFCYVANPENKKKVVQQGDNWFDESLNKVIDNPERRYVMSLSVSDHTGSHWLSAFNEQGLVLLGGTTADELWEYKEHDDPRFAWTFNKHMFKPYNMRIPPRSKRGKMKLVSSAISKKLSHSTGRRAAMSSLRSSGSLECEVLNIDWVQSVPRSLG